MCRTDNDPAPGASPLAEAHQAFVIAASQKRAWDKMRRETGMEGAKPLVAVVSPRHRLIHVDVSGRSPVSPAGASFFPALLNDAARRVPQRPASPGRKSSCSSTL